MVAVSDDVNTFAAASRQTREELLEAGLRLLLRLPASAAFGHLTAARIASEAGRTSGAFFHQWPTTEAYLDDFIAYVLRPEMAVNLTRTAAVSGRPGWFALTPRLSPRRSIPGARR